MFRCRSPFLVLCHTSSLVALKWLKLKSKSFCNPFTPKNQNISRANMCSLLMCSANITKTPSGYRNLHESVKVGVRRSSRKKKTKNTAFSCWKGKFDQTNSSSFLTTGVTDMANIWGNRGQPKYRRTMYRKVKGGDGEEDVIMKFPRARDIQNLIISQYLMKLNDRKTYLAKKYDLGFEKKVDELRKMGERPGHTSQYNSARHERFRAISWRRPPGRPRKGTCGNVEGSENPEISDDDDDDYDIADEVEGVGVEADVIVSSVVQDGQYDFQALVYHPRLSTAMLSYSIYDELKRDVSAERFAEIISECKLWRKRFIKDVFSETFLEIISNYRMVTLSGTKRATYMQSMTVTFLETLRYALKELKWVDILLCLVAFTNQVGKAKGRHGQLCPCALSVMWTYGFLTLINQYKDDISKLILLAKRLTKVFERDSRLYLGIHLAVWLIQKGYFMEAYDLLETDFAIENEKLEMHAFLLRQSYYAMENPKRDQAMFVYYLIKAAYLYTLWQKEVVIYRTCGDFFEPQYEDILRRRGELALGAYEYVYTLQKASGADVMIFLEPFIELLEEYRSVGRARDVLLEMWGENDGNQFFEMFMMDFLEKHAASAPGSWTEQLVKMRDKIKMKFTCTVDREATYSGRRKINRLKARAKKRLSDPQFDKIEKPPFSLR